MTSSRHSSLFDYPERARFGRVVPKNRFMVAGKATRRLREMLTDQVAQIVWQYKLAPETINLSATSDVVEVQVFQIMLKGSGLDQEVLRVIDHAIPFPLIFELVQGDYVKQVAAYKRPAQNSKGEVDRSRWIIGNHFESAWLPHDTPRQPLPVALDMAGLYEKLLIPLVQEQLVSVVADAKNDTPFVRGNVEATSTETIIKEQPERLTLEQSIELVEAIEAQQMQIERIQSRLSREKQFNKRVAINSELHDAKRELQRLTQLKAVAPSY